MPRKGRTGRQNGTSLLEILIGMSVFATGLCALLGIHTAVDHRNRLARERMGALMLAQNAMETQKILGYDLLSDQGPVDGRLGPLDAAGRLSASGLYTISWDVIPDTPVKGVKELRVTASWMTTSGHKRELSLDTVVAQVVSP